jgi:hypothetical protein
MTHKEYDEIYPKCKLGSKILVIIIIVDLILIALVINAL